MISIRILAGLLSSPLLSSYDAPRYIEDKLLEFSNFDTKTYNFSHNIFRCFSLPEIGCSSLKSSLFHLALTLDRKEDHYRFLKEISRRLLQGEAALCPNIVYGDLHS